MSRTITSNIRMTDHEAAVKYPNSYIIMQMDSINSDIGTVLFGYDTESEAIAKLAQLDDMDLCGIVEGINQRCSLGGVVAGG